MNKVLTVSVAAYNVEKYIEKTLDSCVSVPNRDLLEVLVVDDGATDATVEIVRKYEDQYPSVVRLIHKENGGYGTTVNRSIRESRGMFFKLLDGDDWFNSEGLEKLLNYLHSADEDMVFTRMYEVYPDRQLLVEDTWNRYCGKRMRLSDVEAGVHAGMWEIAVRTSILKEHWMDLPERTMYTDHIYIMCPLPFVGDVRFLDFPVYCYRLGYAEQSVSVQSRKKHIDEIVRVSQIVTKYFRDMCKNSPNAVYARERARFCYMEAHRALMLLPFTYQTMQKIKKFDMELRETDESVYCISTNRTMEIIRKTNYWGFFLAWIKCRIHMVLKLYKSH